MSCVDSMRTPCIDQKHLNYRWKWCSVMSFQTCEIVFIKLGNGNIDNLSIIEKAYNTCVKGNVNRQNHVS
jgi:hypothetical protein